METVWTVERSLKSVNSDAIGEILKYVSAMFPFYMKDYEAIIVFELFGVKTLNRIKEIKDEITNSQSEIQNA